MFKNIDKKILILAGLIIVLPIFTMLLLVTLQSCTNRGNSYESYQRLMAKSADRYLKKNNLLPKKQSEVSLVKLETLVAKKYIKSPEKQFDDESCTGFVKVRRTGVIPEKNNEGFLNYIVNLKCKEYKTESFKDILIKKEVKTGSGLYSNGNEYIFKGDRTKNYFSFYGKEYRIMGIDSKGYIKLIRSESEPISRSWDNKYNVEAKHSYGKNIYSDSLILQYLLVDYENAKKINKETKKHIVSNDLCIGKRSVKNFEIDRTIDCSEVIENQLLSLMTVSEYAMASNDPDCNATNSRACNNYNYLYRVAPTTWTPNAVTENTYDILFIANGIMNYASANQYNEYNVILYIDGDETGITGTGTYEDPYTIK